MGRYWLYKATGAGDGRKSPSAVTGKKEKNKNSWSSGCMSGIYNQFRLRHPSLMSSESVVVDNQQYNFCLQGIEAPRNSLESPVNIPVSRIQIKTNSSKFTDGLSTECYNSPSTKTANLVARLMGLDLLPEYSSPRASSSSATTNTHHRSRSLPATPRLSTASRHSTDNNDYHHRLSLQIDKENDFLHLKIKNKTRERASRRLGTDITNAISPARGKCHRRDSNLVLLKPRKTPGKEIIGKAKRDESKQLSSSPKNRLLDIKTNLNKPNLTSPKLRQTSAMKKPEKLVKDEKIKRITSERYDLRLKKMGQQEKVFVNKKSTALSKHVLNVKNIKKFQTFKKEMTSSSSTARLSQKQVSLPSNLNSSYNSNDTNNLKVAAATTTTTSATPAANASCSFSDCELFENSMRRLLSTAFVAEVEEIVVEIEREILGNLVDEIATADSLRSHVRFM